jgi:hypothetical protein
MIKLFILDTHVFGSRVTGYELGKELNDRLQ